MPSWLVKMMKDEKLKMNNDFSRRRSFFWGGPSGTKWDQGKKSGQF